MAKTSFEAIVAPSGMKAQPNEEARRNGVFSDDSLGTIVGTVRPDSKT